MRTKDAFERTLALLLDEVPTVLRGESVRGASPTEWQPQGAVLGSIGFGGAAMRGSIVLVGPPAVWRRLAPPEVGELSEALLCDFVAELCNLLVGRFRNRFLGIGVELACGTPTAAYGHLSLPRLPASSALNVASHRVETAGGSVHLRTDILFGDGFVFPSDTACRLEPPPDDLFF